TPAVQAAPAAPAAPKVPQRAPSIPTPAPALPDQDADFDSNGSGKSSFMRRIMKRVGIAPSHRTSLTSRPPPRSSAGPSSPKNSSGGPEEDESLAFETLSEEAVDLKEWEPRE